MNLQPLRDHIIIEPDPVRDNITSMGIVVKAREGIHTSDEQLGKCGTVVAVGEDIDRDQLAIGNRVLFGEFEYPQYFEGAKRYLVLQDKDICGVID